VPTGHTWPVASAWPSQWAGSTRAGGPLRRNRGGTLPGGAGGQPIQRRQSTRWGLARVRGRCGEMILGLREDRDSPATALHGGARLAGGKSDDAAGRGSGRPSLGPRSNAG
jgi:hypothetical protein